MTDEVNFFKEVLTCTKDVKKDITLAPYTTFKIGGPARFFAIAKSKKELVCLIKIASKYNIPYVILGSGANTLISDNGYNGLVIVAKNNNIDIEEEKITAGAGVSLGQLVTTAVKNGLTGIECWAGIPGTVGGSIYGNMGIPQIKNAEMSDFIVSVTVIKNGNIKEIKNTECEFGYRTSAFKKTDDIIIEATLKLNKSRNVKESLEKMRAYQKKKILEQPLQVPSSGCMFKNPKGKSVGKLVDDLGLKGVKCGGAEISKVHGNFILNTNNAKAEDVKALMDKVKRAIKKEYGLDVEEEVNLIGF
jgi:UDP-N-acetylmuramate dehydrogenase